MSPGAARGRQGSEHVLKRLSRKEAFCLAQIGVRGLPLSPEIGKLANRAGGLCSSAIKALAALRSSLAFSSRRRATSRCSGVDKDAALAKRSLHHRTRDNRATTSQILVDHDDVSGYAKAAQGPMQPHGLIGRVRHLGLDHQKVEVASGICLSPCMRAEQDDPGIWSRRSDSLAGLGDHVLVDDHMELAGLEPATSWVRSRRSAN